MSERNPTRVHGCHNRPETPDVVLVQDGWLGPVKFKGIPTRLPRMVLVRDPMSRDCKYQAHTPDDPKCTGCRWKTSLGVTPENKGK